MTDMRKMHPGTCTVPDCPAQETCEDRDVPYQPESCIEGHPWRYRYEGRCLLCEVVRLRKRNDDRVAENVGLRTDRNQLLLAVTKAEDSIHSIILAIGNHDWTREETLNILRGTNNKLRIAMRPNKARESQ